MLCRKTLGGGVADFEAGVKALIGIFGDNIARKPDSKQFNRAISDALIYYHSQPRIRKLAGGKTQRIRDAYQGLFSPNSNFVVAIESDTAGAPNTAMRLRLWAEALAEATGSNITPPKIPVARQETKAKTGRKSTTGKKGTATNR
jgi:hypothetical protein